MPTLCWLSVKSPITWLRASGCTQLTETHGWGAVPSTNAHPAMMNVSEERSTNPPPAWTLVFELMALTVPPCGHIMTLELLSRLAIAVELAPSQPLLGRLVMLAVGQREHDLGTISDRIVKRL